MLTLAHISDLHFGDASPLAVNALSDELNAMAPDVIIATGDLTQGGRKSEFQQASEFLSRLHSEVLVLPGNHDVPVRNLWARFVAPYARYEKHIGADINPVLADDRVTAVGLNSARRAALDINWSFGRLSRRQIGHAVQNLRAGAVGSLRVVAVHHPFVQGPGTAGSRIVGRGEEALSAFAENGLDILFTGHVHVSKAEAVDVNGRGVVIAQAGTAASRRTRGQAPSYNFIRASSDVLQVDTRELGGPRFEQSQSVSFQKSADAGWREST